jgi:hypothetical protein
MVLLACSASDGDGVVGLWLCPMDGVVDLWLYRRDDIFGLGAVPRTVPQRAAFEQKNVIFVAVI